MPSLPPLSAKPHASTLPIGGILVLIASTWALSGLDASGKWVMGLGVPLLLMCWFRYVIHFFLVLALVFPSKGWGVFRSQRPRAQLLRGIIMMLATFSLFTALRYLPQAEATAINFLAPLIVLAAAPWLLKEKSYVSRWIAAGVGLIGVLIIIRPGSDLPPVGIFFGLITACMFAMQFIVTRRVAIDNAMTTLLWSGAIGSLCLTIALPFILPAALPILKTLTPLQWLVLASTGFWGALGHLWQIQAYRLAPASLLAPFVYLQIIAAGGLGWLIWGHFPDRTSWFGILIICVSGIVIGAIEWRRVANTDH
ncbi:DMT family transporter [Alcaligenes endophyticus]|uniref:DMT family transporter n=1 Tax=Alcaligenes endophyticus TaxID=1929088 RepID=A0ABT8EEH1_9BURK|nr:DMT family transporter [Alcaligenes endophyticus]MCX5592235.1 DMT family transporter [Alcaligenes endophyticus]MDN4119677.1 DMT family transporter [Alcaligenes endophyticus]